ncbi:protein-tyrosine phosphatase-like protein [Lasiosphaeria ovina]|uniref:protein-tyrosine-phosphatase n=1 Tax=Lasiosphaeria ovina TaxID=92902 RepID=A0AAE0K3I5_9PEZI|nr:protein-tyrosine phosphatase-like protein [Lasiosphaeria ovina]
MNAEPIPSEEVDEPTWWSARKPTPESAEYPYVDKYRFGIGIVTPAIITEIRPGMYIGDPATIMSTATLQKHGITSIVSLRDDEDDKHWFDQRAALRALVPAANHLYIVFEDSHFEDFLPILAGICDFIDAQLAVPGGRVVVHCTAGISRSPAFVAAYLMRCEKAVGYKQYAHEIMSKRDVAEFPMKNFAKQLAVWGATGYNVWEDEQRTVPQQQYREYLKWLKEKEEEREKKQ